jgi:hypothetical protein
MDALPLFAFIIILAGILTVLAMPDGGDHEL